MGLRIKKGDTKPWVFTLKQNGSGVDLDGATVELNMQDQALTSVITGGSVTPDPDQTTNPGKCSYSPVAGDVDTVGAFLAEIKVTFGDGTIARFPNGEAGEDEFETVTITNSLG